MENLLIFPRRGHTKELRIQVYLILRQVLGTSMHRGRYALT